MECKKVSYTEEKYALDDIKRISARSTRSKTPVRPYLCHCGFWHLTSQDNKQTKEVLELKKKIAILEKQVKAMETGEAKEIFKEIKTDERIKTLASSMSNQTKTIKRIRQDNQDLIVKNLKLERELALLQNK